MRSEIKLLPQSAKTYFNHILYAKEFKFDEENYQKLLDEYKRLKENNLAFLSIKEVQNAKPFVLGKTRANEKIFETACVESEFWEYVQNLEEETKLYRECLEYLHRLHINQAEDDFVVTDIMDIL